MARTAESSERNESPAAAQRATLRSLGIAAILLGLILCIASIVLFVLSLYSDPAVWGIDRLQGLCDLAQARDLICVPPA